jgi:hypothetical protein
MKGFGWYVNAMHLAVNSLALLNAPQVRLFNRSA